MRRRTSLVRRSRAGLLLLVLEAAVTAFGQTAPVFEYTAGGSSYKLACGDPARGGTTTIATTLAPISLSFEPATGVVPLDATPDVAKLLQSPIFSPFAFPAGPSTQFADAMLRATFPKAKEWHTMLAAPEVTKTVAIAVPASAGYVLRSRASGGSLAVVDIEFLQRELFRQLGRQPGKLVIAVTRNTTYYTEGDATLCCSWGTHGRDSATGNSFILASYLDGAAPVVEDRDVQPLSQQLAEFIYDPLHDPLVRQGADQKPGNQFPAWMRPASMRPGDQGRCGGTGIATAYFLLEPTDTNHKNNVPASKPYAIARGGLTYHVQNVALLGWYLGDSGNLGRQYSFPDPQALKEPARPCPARGMRDEEGKPGAVARQKSTAANGHQLIGYWAGYGPPGWTPRQIAPQWDVVIVAFATPDKTAPEGTLRFNPPGGLDAGEFKSAIAYLKGEGKKVLISLGGGGQYFTLADAKNVPNFVSSVSRIVSDYDFDGIDIDFEYPSLALDGGDTDFKHPATPSIANVIRGLRELRERFGPGFMISLVPEGTQAPAGSRSYGGQFGSYLPLAWGIRDILTFMDVQDYNTPPLEGLNGEIYQAGTVDYHAAMTELVLRGFSIGGGRKQFFPGLPQNKVAVGFLVGETTPDVVSAAMDYLITGKAPAGIRYQLRSRGGYGGMIGAMFWTIDADQHNGFEFSNAIGPQLHSYAAGR
jgi:chitinase